MGSLPGFLFATAHPKFSPAQHWDVHLMNLINFLIRFWLVDFELQNLGRLFVPFSALQARLHIVSVRSWLQSCPCLGYPPDRVAPRVPRVVDAPLSVGLQRAFGVIIFMEYFNVNLFERGRRSMPQTACTSA